MKNILRYIIKLLNIQCCRGCNSKIVGIYWLNKGCICDKSKFQWLCAQHLIKLEPLDKMECLIDIWKIKGY